MTLDYEAKYKEVFRQNVNDTPKAAIAGELDRKIDNFCKLHDFDRNKVIREIQNNRMLAAMFAKNPNKQNFYANLAAEYIKNIPGVSNFNQVNNKLYLLGGGVFKHQELKARNASNKAISIDFVWNFSDQVIYATHKYTKGVGGSQKSAYKDVQEFIKEANDSTSSNKFFLAIADGDHYQTLDNSVGMLRLKRLQNLSNNNQVFACSINSLEELLNRLPV